MEISSMVSQDRQNPSPVIATHTCNGSGSPIPITRSDPNSPYPTTFVTADPSSFKQVVQMLTGSSESASKQPSNAASAPATPTGTHHNDHLPPPPPPPSSRNFVIPPVKTAPSKKQQQQQGFKLYERRNHYNKNGLSRLPIVVGPLTANFPQFQNPSSVSPRKPPEILSPSILDFPSLTLSPVTPLPAAGEDDQFDKSSHSSEEERAIAEKGFYLQPSPMSTPRDAEPQLLPLFPVTSPRFSDPSSSAS